MSLEQSQGKFNDVMIIKMTVFYSLCRFLGVGSTGHEPPGFSYMVQI